MNIDPDLLYVIDINCELTYSLFSSSSYNNRRPGSLRADAFRGHGFSLYGRKLLPMSFQTRAIPSGVHRPTLTRLVRVHFLLLITMLIIGSEPILVEETHVDFCGISGQSETLKNESSKRLTGSPAKSGVCFRSEYSITHNCILLRSFIHKRHSKTKAT